MEKFEERKTVEFTNHEEKIFGVLHQPIGVEKAPAVIFCHGLAGHRIGKHRMYVLLAESLARAGIASFRFDFRGSGDSEGSFAEMSLQGEASDAEAALHFLMKQPNIDPNRIGIFGRSFGGAIAIIAAHRFKQAKAIALWAPVFNAEQWEEQWEKVTTHKVSQEERQELMRINGQLPSLSFYKELFSLKLDEELVSLENTPMLLIHGQKDPLVGIEHSRNYVELRKSAPASTDFIELPHSDHDFDHPEEKNHAINETCNWLAKNL